MRSGTYINARHEDAVAQRRAVYTRLDRRADQSFYERDNKTGCTQRISRPQSHYKCAKFSFFPSRNGGGGEARGRIYKRQAGAAAARGVT